MDIKSYLDDHDNDLPKAMKTLDDGRRVKENVKIEKLEDGTTNEVHEILEEVVPLRVAKRISRKMMSVPVEETVECIGEDGDVTTSKRSLDTSLLNLDGKVDPLTELANEVRALRNSKIAPDPQPTMPDNVCHASEKSLDDTKFFNKAKAMFGETKQTSFSGETSESNLMSNVITFGACLVIGILCGLIYMSM